jgi:hypothetical protein
MLGMPYTRMRKISLRVATSHPESIYSTTAEQKQISISCVLMNYIFNVEHYHNAHSTQYRCTHYSPHITRKSLRGVTALVRCGGNMYWWVD